MNKLICVTNYFNGGEKELTKGKTYEVIDELPSSVYVENDFGQEMLYDKRFFRNIKMENINTGLLLARLTDNIVTEINSKIENRQNQMDVIKDNNLAKANWNGQIIGLNEAIKVVADELVKILEQINDSGRK